MKSNSQKLSTALKQDPNNIQLLIETARYFISTKEPGKFLDLFQQIYSLNASSKLPPQIIFSIGQTALESQYWNLASDLFGILQKKDRSSLPLIGPLSEALIKSGRLSEAKNVLEEAIHSQFKPDPGLLTNYAIVLSETGSYDSAEKVYRQVVAIRPNEFLGHYNLAGFLETLGRVDEAITEYKACLDIVPEAPEAINRLSNLAQMQSSQKNSEREKGGTNLNMREVYLAIEEKNWDSAVSKLLQNKQSIDAIRWHAAVLELPKEQQDKISMSKFYDPNIQVKRKNLFGHTDPILEEIVSEIKNDPSLVWNRAGKPTRSGFQTHELFQSNRNSTAISQLINKLTDTLLEMPRQEQEKLTGEWSIPIKLSGWGVILKQEGFQKRHIHPEARFSGVLYLRVPSNQDETQASGKGNLCFSSTANESQLQIEPEPGLAVLFPSYFPHGTIPLSSSEERICIAFNVQ